MNFTGERFIPTTEDDTEITIEHFQRYNAIKKLVKGKTVLDAACGEGYGTYLLSEYTAQIYGVDIDEETVKEARKKYIGSNIEYLNASIEKLPFEDHSFDIVVSFETIEHVDEDIQKRFLSEIKRILKNDGLLIMSTPNKAIYSDEFNFNNEFHIKEFYYDEFVDFIQKKFKNIEVYKQYKEIGYFLTSNKEESIYKLGGYSPQYAKYYLCVASDMEIKNLGISQVDIVNEKKYIYTMHRLLETQEEIEDRNKHLKNLDLENETKNEHIRKLQIEVENRNKHINKLDLEINTKNKRIVELQNEVEDRNEHIKFLDKNIEQQQDELQLLQDKNKERDNIMEDVWDALKQDSIIKDKYIITLEEHKTNLQNEVEKLKIIQIEKEELINELKEEVHILQVQLLQEREQHINEIALKNRINELETNLNNIYSSTGWKLLLKLYKIRDSILPRNSKRRLLAQILKKSFNNPKLYLKALTVSNMKKLKYYLKNEDTDKILDRAERFEEKKRIFELQPINEIEIFNFKEDYEKIEFNKEQNPLVSIIIPVYNQWEYTYNCLLSIKKNTTNVSYEIIIADDVSQDDTKRISEYVKNIKVLRNEKNLGFLLNCKNAAQYAKGKYIHFLNNDTNVQENWLSSLIELIESDEAIGMVGSKLVYANGKLQEAGGIIWGDASGWNFGNLDDPEKPEYNYVKDVDYISGASILIRTSLWKEIGGFDERYVPAYFEDSDLAFEVRKHGYRVVYQPRSVVVHFEGISHGTDVNSGIKSYQVKNKEKFIKKWSKQLEEHFQNGENVFIARDRSSNKKTLLMIDHYVPHFDKDAGSRTVFQYLNLFVEQGYNVKFIGDNFFKHEPYTEVLQQKGIEVLYGPYYADNWKKWIKDNSKYIDYIFLNRPHISEKYMDYIKNNTRSKIIYYGHDLHFLRERREYELTHNEEAYRNSKYWKTIELQLMRKADVVYYPSQVEVDEIIKIDEELHVKSIPAYIFDDSKPTIDYNFSERRDLMFIGGFGHRPNVDAVLWLNNEILPKLVAEEPNIKIYILGSNPPKEIKALENENLLIKGFVTDEELIEFYTQCRISIVPLRYGAGIKGKVVEAMYNQIPVMTTSVGAEGIIESEKVLTVADEIDEFVDKLIALYRDEKELTRISKQSREYISTHFTKEAVVQIIQEDFNI